MPIHTIAVIPALDAADTIAQVVEPLHQLWPEVERVIVVDDGSIDQTAKVAERAGAWVVRHRRNLGKGAALRCGLAHAYRLGAHAAVTLDADGQHPVQQARRIGEYPAPAESLILGIRDLCGAGAPRANRFSNGISNWFLSLFSGKRLGDTQCGLRRYPLPATLQLGGQAMGFGYEAEIVLRAAWAGLDIVQVPIQVTYPAPDERRTHFRVVRDPARIVCRVLATCATTPRRSVPASTRP